MSVEDCSVAAELGIPPSSPHYNEARQLRSILAPVAEKNEELKKKGDALPIDANPFFKLPQVRLHSTLTKDNSGNLMSAWQGFAKKPPFRRNEQRIPNLGTRGGLMHSQIYLVRFRRAIEGRVRGGR